MFFGDSYLVGINYLWAVPVSYPHVSACGMKCSWHSTVLAVLETSSGPVSYAKS